MSVFSDAELTYLAKGKLGRLATIDGAGMPHVVPLGWRYNPELDTIDIGGRDFAQTRKFRNAQHNPNVALVVDDVLPPWRPRCVLIRGRAEALADATGPGGEPTGPIIRVYPTEVISWGMESAGEQPCNRHGDPAGVSLAEAALFNGIRSSSLDYIYRDEIGRFAAEGVLNHVHVATSRDRPGRREYVQDRIREQGALVWRLLAADGYVYVCGSQPMRNAVRAAFAEVLTEHASMPPECAEAYLNKLETTARYRPDLWS